MDIKIQRFAEQMQIEIDNNSHKTGGIQNWKGLQHKIADFEYHKAKMIIAMRCQDPDAIKEYIADCANILMSIGDEYGLYDFPMVKSESKTVIGDQVFNKVPITDLTITKSFI